VVAATAPCSHAALPGMCQLSVICPEKAFSTWLPAWLSSATSTPAAPHRTAYGDNESSRCCISALLPTLSIAGMSSCQTRSSAARSSWLAVSDPPIVISHHAVKQVPYPN
jgi:hypothetical protein